FSSGCWRLDRARWHCACTGFLTPPIPGGICCLRWPAPGSTRWPRSCADTLPPRWRRLVTLAVPPAALDEVLYNDYEQLKRFFYLFMFRDPAGLAETVVARDDLAFLDQLWRDWSPGFQAGEHLAQ